ncbi:MAG: FGGY-family carbohydrate kinase [Gammaproteobacteria bacterium]|nr:FGGY-family carbohydrate kinase [Gammaproteobacteria bacterium]
MPAPPLHIGIDLGTSGCRAIALKRTGEIVARQQQPLPARQTPELWWQTTHQLLATLFSRLNQQQAGAVESITVDGTSSTLLLTDPQGTPLTPALMYNDQRAIQEAQLIREVAPPESGAHGPSSSLAKLFWLLRHYPALRNRPLLALHQADWISNRLAGHFGQSDENNCLKLGYDPIQRRWPEWIKALTLPAGVLPNVGAPAAPYGTLTPELTAAWGVNQSSPITICRGTTDSVAAAVAAGVSQEGDAVTSLGSTLVLKILSSVPLFAAKYGIYSHRLGEQWLISGASNAGGATLLNHFSIEQIRSLSENISTDNPTMLNYYPLPASGERFPISDPNYPPQLSPRPREDHRFLQGMLEGLSRIEQQGYQKMVELGAPPPGKIYSAGGGSQNQPWMQIRQRLIDVPIVLSQHPDAAYGAAWLTMREWPESREIRSIVPFNSSKNSY